MKKIKLETGCYKKIHYWDNKETKIEREQYYNSKDEYHRKYAPARIFYHRSGEIDRERYYINGKCHRLNGPAAIWYYESGKIEIENYYIKGKRHRLNGPARIWYFKSGETDKEYYYINDIEYSKEDWIVKSNKIMNIDRNLKLLSKVY